MRSQWTLAAQYHQAPSRQGSPLDGGANCHQRRVAGTPTTPSTSSSHVWSSVSTKTSSFRWPHSADGPGGCDNPVGFRARETPWWHRTRCRSGELIGPWRTATCHSQHPLTATEFRRVLGIARPGGMWVEGGLLPASWWLAMSLFQRGDQGLVQVRGPCSCATIGIGTSEQTDRTVLASSRRWSGADGHGLLGRRSS